MRPALWLVLGCLASAPALAGTWSNLWRTPDQQGEAMLAAGDPVRAATRFADPRLKAYADLEAGRYAQAATLLKPFKDSTSEYNRGNALARSGHLRAALAAYDAALKQAPHDKDIRHNRDLLARLLKRHPPKSAAHSGGRGRRHGSKASGNTSHKGSGAKHSGTKRPGKGSGTTGGGSGHGASGSSRRKRGLHGSAAGSAGGAPAGQGTGRNGHGSAAQTGRNGAAGKRRTGTGLAKHRAGQAKRDAAMAAAIARNRAHRGHGTHPAGAAGMAARAGGKKPLPGARRRAAALGGGTHTPKRKPVSEKTLALEQWLRQIPNNPAGLLRRKFLIEYMMRHPGESR